MHSNCPNCGKEAVSYKEEPMYDTSFSSGPGDPGEHVMDRYYFSCDDCGNKWEEEN